MVTSDADAPIDEWGDALMLLWDSSTKFTGAVRKIAKLAGRGRAQDLAHLGLAETQIRLTGQTISKALVDLALVELSALTADDEIANYDTIPFDDPPTRDGSKLSWLEYAQELQSPRQEPKEGKE